MNKKFNQSNEEKLEKKKSIIKSNIINNANKVLRRLNQLPSTPDSLNIFTGILKKIFVDMKGIDNPGTVKTIGIFCVMIPEELIYAAGAIPVKLCSGIFAAATLGEDLTPRDACPLVKSVIGISSIEILPIYSDTAKYIVPTSCDCKRKMVYEVSKFKPVLPMHIPASRSDDNFVNNYVKDLYTLKNTLEDITGNSITRRRLKYWIKSAAEAQQQAFRLFEIQKNNPSVVLGTHVISVMNAYAYEHVEKWTKSVELLNNELENRIKYKAFIGRENSPRILFTGSPIIFPNIKIPILIEESGGIIVADETCMGTRRLYDPVGINDTSYKGMMRALAVRYILPCTCPTFVQNKQRIFKIKQMIEDFKVDGIIYHVLRGCQVYDFEYQAIEEEMNKLEIPVLRVETDYNEEDIEQLRIRLEAFIEMIKYKDL